MGSSSTLPKKGSLEVKLISDCEKQFPMVGQVSTAAWQRSSCWCAFWEAGRALQLAWVMYKGRDTSADSWREMLSRAPSAWWPLAQEHGCGCRGCVWICKFYFWMNSNLNPKMPRLPSTAFESWLAQRRNLRQELGSPSSDWHSSALCEQQRYWDRECCDRLLKCMPHESCSSVMLVLCDQSMPCTYSRR